MQAYVIYFTPASTNLIMANNGLSGIPEVAGIEMAQLDGIINFFILTIAIFRNRFLYCFGDDGVHQFVYRIHVHMIKR